MDGMGDRGLPEAPESEAALPSKLSPENWVRSHLPSL